MAVQYDKESGRMDVDSGIGKGGFDASATSLDEIVQRHEDSLRRHLDFLKSFCSIERKGSDAFGTARSFIRQTEDMQTMISKLRLNPVENATSEMETRTGVEPMKASRTNGRAMESNDSPGAGDMFTIDKSPMTAGELERRLSVPSTPDEKVKKRKADIEQGEPDTARSHSSRKSKKDRASTSSSKPGKGELEDSFVAAVEARHKAKEVARLEKSKKKRKRESADSSGDGVFTNAEKSKHHNPKKSKRKHQAVQDDVVDTHVQRISAGESDKTDRFTVEGSGDVNGVPLDSKSAKRKSSKRKEADDLTTERSKKRRKKDTKARS